MLRLVQLHHGSDHRVALVEEPHLRLLADCASIPDLANAALRDGQTLGALAQQRATTETLVYDDVYAGRSGWRLLPPTGHFGDPARCMVSGTGLTHLGSAKNRNAMHTVTPAETDSMKMFRWGVEGGRPGPGKIGIAPEWFYKGPGSILRTTGEPLVSPQFAEDGGEEAEIAGIYLIDAAGQPHRLGMALGNEFSDHKFEKRNYLNLAGSKLRPCGLGPELVVDPAFGRVPGRVSLERAGKIFWSKDIATGEEEMCHSLANIEHHHFKFDAHRSPGDLHVHYYGACALSFGDGVQLQDGDVMVIEFTGFGRPLRNPLKVLPPNPGPVTVRQFS